MILVTGSVDDLDEKLVRAIRGDAFFYLHAREGGAGLGAGRAGLISVPRACRMSREVDAMGKIIDCGQVAPDSGCTHVVRGRDEEEALRNAGEHARKDHGLEPTPELMARVRAAMRDE